MAPTGPTLRVLSLLGDADAIGLPADLRGRVEVVDLAAAAATGAEAPAGDVLLVSALQREAASAAAAAVPWVHLYGTGTDGVDLDVLAAGRVVTNVRGAAAVPISEWVLATMLAFVKQLPEAWVDEPPDRWFEPRQLGTLAGARLGLVGLGTIGSAVARRALAFDVEVRALRRSSRPAGADIELVGSLADVVAEADHVVLALPLTPETEGFLDDAAFAAMAPGVHVVNVARGGLIVEGALRRALDAGVVARASLDATEPEPLPPGHWMYAHPGVRVSPHVSWSAPGAAAAMMAPFFTNLRRRVAGEDLVNVVDPATGY